GILLAIALSLLDHVRRGYRPHTAIMLRDTADNWRMEPVMPGKHSEPGLVVFWFGADLYYASAGHFCEQVLALVHDSPQPVRWLVVDAGAITGVDYSAGAALKDLHENLRKHAASLAFAHVNADLKANLDRLGLTELIGENRLFDKLRDCVAAYQAQ
ncbi:MAG: sodium-independent anion transporter, partial [Accumulibacter sp.]